MGRITIHAFALQERYGSRKKVFFRGPATKRGGGGKGLATKKNNFLKLLWAVCPCFFTFRCRTTFQHLCHLYSLRAIGKFFTLNGDVGSTAACVQAVAYIGEIQGVNYRVIPVPGGGTE